MGWGETSYRPQEVAAYSAQGELLWKKDQLGTEHVFDYDARGRLEHDRVTVLGTGLDGAVRRISRNYDALDRPLKVTSWSSATVGSGSVVNEVQLVYGRYDMPETIYQEWVGAVNTGTSRKVQFAYSYPTAGSTGLRRTSTTTTAGTAVTDEYNSGMDDTLSRLSGRKNGASWLFQESYLGFGRLVERAYGSTGVTWTLVGTDSSNNDNYKGLDRFGRIDHLIVKTSSTHLNEYEYFYNYSSQITDRKDAVGYAGGAYKFSEHYDYDNLRRLTGHKQGVYPSYSTVQWNECWTLNRSGGTTEYKDGPTTCSTTTSFTLNASNEITYQNSVPYTYNHPGDLTVACCNHEYDAWNRMVGVLNGSVYIAKYQYNGLNQKVKRTNSTGVADTYYYYNDSWQLIEERQVSDGTVLAWYAWGSQYIDDLAVRTTSATKFVVSDARFSVCTILNADGTVASRYCYNAYGYPWQLSADWSTWQVITEDLFLFTGRLYQKAHQQYDVRNRVQDPALGYYVQTDPIGNHSDPRGSGNAYGFVANDPQNNVDPYGLLGMTGVGSDLGSAVLRTSPRLGVLSIASGEFINVISSGRVSAPGPLASLRFSSTLDSLTASTCPNIFAISLTSRVSYGREEPQIGAIPLLFWVIPVIAPFILPGCGSRRALPTDCVDPATGAEYNWTALGDKDKCQKCCDGIATDQAAIGGLPLSIKTQKTKCYVTCNDTFVPDYPGGIYVGH